MSYRLLRLMLILSLPLIFGASIIQDDFLIQQKKYSRVRTAITEKEDVIESDLAKLNLSKNNYELILLAFKEEKELQLFVKKKDEATFSWLKTFNVCASSGELGPKVKQGDGQVPEGFYHIDRFNPVSNFYLSLGLNYPNLADKRRNPGGNLGGDIFIHGNCVTIGCLPMTDDKIKEIYMLAVYAKNNGQNKIPVYVFPFKMTDENMKTYESQYKSDTKLIAFWKTLKPGFDDFIKTRKALKFSVSAKGEYSFDT